MSEHDDPDGLPLEPCSHPLKIATSWSWFAHKMRDVVEISTPKLHANQSSDDPKTRRRGTFGLRAPMRNLANRAAERMKPTLVTEIRDI
jgi:fumarylacetoacetate (FAA) hydrolase family protein